ncbi:MAG: restriction endonuclease subunit R, partial [bacterium]|nr:restriction endonuclease subunit R [bacterium]
TPEYAEVYGVPFSFIPTAGTTEVVPPPQTTRVRALPERIDCEISFPRLDGYRYDLPTETLKSNFDKDSEMELSTEDIPIDVDIADIIGGMTIHSIEDMQQRRIQEVEYAVARTVLEKYFREDEERKVWLFPQLLEITREWIRDCVTCKDKCFPQLLLLTVHAHNAADRIYRGIVAGEEGEKKLMPILRPYDTVGYTRYVDFDTARPVWPTRADKCHVSHVVGDTESWEQKVAQTLEEMDEVVAYVKNENLGFYIPYTYGGRERNYLTDFIVRIDDGRGEGDLLNLIIEVTGERRPEKVAKVDTASKLWVPAVNNYAGFGRWAFIEITDPWDMMREIQELINDK